ncbi:AMP-binding protein [Marispirochaeta sp.]|uniref:AMP-dependent synthetase/ligase n=1 Tax=Marispirochaeta sp. TaxID=2038653 RepID=UPI0029C665B6|nr:AMP-binding protein [Marispirochaeta sp.]
MNKQDTLIRRFKTVVASYGDKPALFSKNGGTEFTAITYQQLYLMVRDLAAGLAGLGIQRGDHIGILSDNRKEWLITDLAAISLGAIDVPRGSDSTAEEYAYILAHADCRIAFVENTAQGEKVASKKEKLPRLEIVICFDPPEELTIPGVQVYSFQEIIDRGAARDDGDKLFSACMEKGDADDVVTIIYTSGTTGEPKGVVLTNRSYIFQLDRIYEFIPLRTEDRFFSVLPSWHSYERAIEYIVINRGASIIYSKPVGAVMLADMAATNPHWMTSVPRIWEAIRAAVLRSINTGSNLKKSLFYFFLTVGQTHFTLLAMVRGLMPQFVKRSRWFDFGVAIVPFLLLTPIKFLGDLLVFRKIKQKLGSNFRAGVSGGGALPPHVDRFFQAAGIKILEGYGLTETAPILSVRKFSSPVPNTIGPLLPDIEYRLIDNDGALVPPGKKGVLYVKSEQIMQGYYKRPETTAEVLRNGWLNTGDIAVMTHKHELKIIGRAKETIVLLGGENIEPIPIEDQLTRSGLIDQTMVVGQDQKFLGALIVPNKEALEQEAKNRGIVYVDADELLEDPEISDIMHDEIQALVNSSRGFKHFERIFRFKLLSRPFEVGRELTQTMKIRRNVVDEIYRREIRELFE